MHSMTDIGGVLSAAKRNAERLGPETILRMTVKGQGPITPRGGSDRPADNIRSKKP